MIYSNKLFFPRVLHLAFILVIILPIFSIPLYAEEIPDAVVRELSEEIKVDGILDESSWKEVPGIDSLTQVEPHQFEVPTERTKVWFAYNKDALYIAVFCEDRNPEQIVATEMVRDAHLDDNDNIEIVLDTYHDRRNAYLFSTNAVGAIVDGRITENHFPSMDWDGIWNVRTHSTDKGWSAEFEIPFKTIGFNPDISTWGFNISRYLTRNREISRWASPSLDVEIFHVERAGTISGINEATQGIGLDVKLYGIVGFSRDIIDSTRITEDYDTNLDYDGGADIFYRITSNLVSITTINTDFAETEVDARQVNLTRFPLFFPEKRAFFLEDAGIFEFAKTPPMGPPDQNMGGDIIPFFSRRIGLVFGSEVPIRVGQKFTGKVGRFDVGLLGVRTGSLGASETMIGQSVESQDLSVGRVKANFLKQSYIGAIFTYGDPTGLTTNRMAGIDFKLATSNFLNKNKNLSLVLFGSKTHTSNLEDSDSAYGGTISYPNDFIEAELKWMKIGENYNPALGFVPRGGIRVSSVTAEVSPRPKFKYIRQMAFEFAYSDYYNLAKQSWESKELRLNPIRLNLESGEFLGYDYTYNKEQLFDNWMINPRLGVTLSPGVYSFGAHKFFFMTFPGRPLSLMTDFGFGDFYSGTRREFHGELTWRKDRHLNTSILFNKNWIKLPEGNFNTSLVMCRVSYSFTPLITLTNFVQYDTESRNVGLQSRLRWIMEPGKEFFFVLNHNWQENVTFDRYEDQTRFRIKFNYTFRF
ncbi:DUF5916 domain-containing protein [Thermodesulfobacteriota bacterium]